MTVENGQFVIQNQSVLALCEEFGTPLYVYDGDKIEEKVNALKDAFKGVKMKIKYACKANTNISILKLMHTLGVDIDVVSPQEMAVALKAGFNPSQITYTSSGVSFDEIEESIKNDVLANIDNLPTLIKFGEKYGDSVPVLIRIRPNVEGGGNLKISTGHKESKFGIAIEYKEQILEIAKKYKLNIVGIHQHTGSDIKDGKTFVEVAKVIFDFAMSFPDLQYIDFGGGFKVAYKDGDSVTDMVDLGEKISASFQDFCTKYGRELELWFEPGKFLVSESGFLFGNVNVVKENPTKTLLGLNTGLNHLIRPMMYDAFHDVVNVSKPNAAVNEVYDVVGYICETDDIAKNRELAKTEEGDIICIKNAGAYGFTMASNYNGRFKPAEILIYKNKVHLIRKRETLVDILANQILVEL